MKMRHRGIRLTRDNFDEIWASFSAYSQFFAPANYRCRGCDARYFCDVCPGEMDFLYGNPVERPEILCGPARIRRDFYRGKISFEEALNAAELIDKSNGEGGEIL